MIFVDKTYIKRSTYFLKLVLILSKIYIQIFDVLFEAYWRPEID